LKRDAWPGTAPMESKPAPIVVAVGDRMLVNTALLQQIHEGPDHHSELVEVERIILEPDGTKVLWLKRVERPT
jgi:hypothetical protein